MNNQNLALARSPFSYEPIGGPRQLVLYSSFFVLLREASWKTTLLATLDGDTLSH